MGFLTVANVIPAYCLHGELRCAQLHKNHTKITPDVATRCPSERNLLRGFFLRRVLLTLASEAVLISRCKVNAMKRKTTRFKAHFYCVYIEKYLVSIRKYQMLNRVPDISYWSAPFYRVIWFHMIVLSFSSAFLLCALLKRNALFLTWWRQYYKSNIYYLLSTSRRVDEGIRKDDRLSLPQSWERCLRESMTKSFIVGWNRVKYYWIIKSSCCTVTCRKVLTIFYLHISSVGYLKWMVWFRWYEGFFCSGTLQ